MKFASSSTDERGCQTCHFNENGWCEEHSGRRENYCNQHAHHLNVLAARVHQANAKWWTDISKQVCSACGDVPGSGNCILSSGHNWIHPPLNRNVGELLMLSVSELAEAMEGHRKDLMDDKLPHRKMFDVEIADCVIRLLDICGGMGIDLGAAFEEKMAFNAVRADHQIESRKAEGGKKY